MNKHLLSEQEIRTQYITPAIKNAGWKFRTVSPNDFFWEEYPISAGRIQLHKGAFYKRGEQRRADYVLFYKKNIPIAVIEAKKNTYSVSEGIQQGLTYAEDQFLKRLYIKAVK